MVDVSAVRLCDVCKEAGRISVLELYQLNLTDALLLCPEEQCTFPLGKKTTYPTIVKRHANDIPRSKRRSSRASSCLSSPALPPSGISTPNYGLLLSPGLQTSGVSLYHQPPGVYQQNNSFSLVESSFAKPNHNLDTASISFAKPSSTAPSSHHSVSHAATSLHSLAVSSQNGHQPLVSLSSFSATTTNTTLLTSSISSPNTFSPNIGQVCQNALNPPASCISGFPATNSTAVTAPADIPANDSFDALDLELDLLNMEVPVDGEEAKSIIDSLSQLLNDTETVSNVSESPTDAMMKEPPGIVHDDQAHFSDHSYASIDVDSLLSPVQSRTSCAANDTQPATQNPKPINLPNESQLDSSCQTLSNIASDIIPKTSAPVDYNNAMYSAITDRMYSGTVRQLVPSNKPTDSGCVGAGTRVPSGGTIAESMMYPQWMNQDSLCWLDVIMCLLVHCYSLHQLAQSLVKTNIVRTLCDTYQQACQVLGNHGYGNKLLSLETSVGTVCVKTGGGECLNIPSSVNSANEKLHLFDDIKVVDELISDLGDKSTLMLTPIKADPIERGQDILDACSDLFKDSPNRPNKLKDSPGQYKNLTASSASIIKQHLNPDSIQKATLLLNTVREQVWASIQPRLRSRRGSHDSPLFALPLILEQDPSVDDLFMVGYTWKMVCCHCGHQHEDRVSRTVPTFPNVPGDFSMMAPCFIRSCVKCNAPQQRMNMVFDRLPPVLVIHFVNGLTSTPLSSYDFKYRGATYHVTGVVQYCTRPSHFVTWLRNLQDNRWMECDDLKSPLCRYEVREPSFSPSQVHLMMWERHGDITPIASSPVSREVSASLPLVFQSPPIMVSSPVRPNLPEQPTPVNFTLSNMPSVIKQENGPKASVPLTKFKLDTQLKSLAKDKHCASKVLFTASVSGKANYRGGLSDLSHNQQDNQVIGKSNLARRNTVVAGDITGLTNFLVSGKEMKATDESLKYKDVASCRRVVSAAQDNLCKPVNSRATGTKNISSQKEVRNLPVLEPVGTTDWCTSLSQKLLQAQQKIHQSQNSSCKSTAVGQYQVGSICSSVSNPLMERLLGAKAGGTKASNGQFKSEPQPGTCSKFNVPMKANSHSGSGISLKSQMNSRMERLRKNLEMMRERQSAGLSVTGIFPSCNMSESNLAEVKSSGLNSPRKSSQTVGNSSALRPAARLAGNIEQRKRAFSNFGAAAQFEGYQFGKKTHASSVAEVRHEDTSKPETTSLPASPQKVVRFIDVKKGKKRIFTAGTDPSPPAIKKLAVGETKVSGVKRQITFQCVPSTIAAHSPNITKKLILPQAVSFPLQGYKTSK